MANASSAGHADLDTSHPATTVPSIRAMPWMVGGGQSREGSEHIPGAGGGQSREGGEHISGTGANRGREVSIYPERGSIAGGK
eukprot:576783-Prorocentrum_minimum.AAC.2